MAKNTSRKKNKKKGETTAIATRINIDWDQVDLLIEANLDKKQICAALGISTRQLDMACKRDHGVTFAKYCEPRKRGPGHPPTEIDWDTVDKQLQAQCNGTEIASLLGIHADTLYRACERDKKIGFAAYSKQKKAEGRELIKLKQYA